MERLIEKYKKDIESALESLKINGANKFYEVQILERISTLKRVISDLESVMGKTSDERSNCNKPLVTNCVALPEWLSKERCAVAAGIWNSHQEGDNKRVQAIKQIKEWAADAGYEIGFKKANELLSNIVCNGWYMC